MKYIIETMKRYGREAIVCDWNSKYDSRDLIPIFTGDECDFNPNGKNAPDCPFATYCTVYNETLKKQFTIQFCFNEKASSDFERILEDDYNLQSKKLFKEIEALKETLNEKISYYEEFKNKNED